MKQMDVAANILFRSVGSIYEGTISSSALYPTLYFEETKNQTTYYGFRLREVIPTRLIVRLFESGKDTTVDMIWMVDDSKTAGIGFVYFEPKSSNITISGTPKPYIDKLQNDATIDACYPDLLLKKKLFDGLMLGSREKFSSKLRKELQLKIDNVPTSLCAFSRFVLETNGLKKENYQEEVVNAFLSLIDLVHRSFEVLSVVNQRKDDSTIYCVRCGHKLSSDSFYCPLCGSKQN